MEQSVETPNIQHHFGRSFMTASCSCCSFISEHIPFNFTKNNKTNYSDEGVNKPLSCASRNDVNNKDYSFAGFVSIFMIIV